MTSEMIQKLMITAALIVIIVGVVGYQLSQMQTQNYAEEVTYATTLLKQAGDFIRTHASHGGQTKLGTRLQFGSIKLTPQGMCLVRFDVGGGNIITLYQGAYTQLRYESPHAMYGETWIFDRGDRPRAFTTTPDHIDAVYRYSMGGYTYVSLRTATYVALTRTQGALTLSIYVFYLDSASKGGAGTFTLNTNTESVVEHLRFMATTGASPALYIQTGVDSTGRLLEEQVPLPPLNAGDLIDASVNLVSVSIAW